MSRACLRFAVACCAWLGGPLAASGCGGSSFENGVFRSEYTAYRVGPLDTAWQRVQVDDNDLAFYRPGSGTIGATATCTSYDDVPHVALMNHLMFGMTDRNYRTEEDVTLDGRSARHVVIDAELDGAPVTLEVFLLTKNGCVYDLSLVTGRRVYARSRDDFLRFVSGFEVLPLD